MNKLLKRFFTIVILLLAAACSDNKKDQQGVSSSTKKKITLTHYFSGTLSGGISDMIRRFNENNREYELTVTALDHEAFKTSILENLDRENAPDIYSYWAGSRVLSVLDKLQPIDKIWDENGMDKVFSASVINSACSYDNKKYLLPITQHFVGFYYNKKIFNEAGLTIPKTWADFIKICSILKKRGVTPIALGSKSKWPAQFWFDYLLLRTASSEYREKLMHGLAGYQDKEVTKVFKIWSGLLKKGYFNSDPNLIDWDSGAAEHVYNGKAAMTLMGTWLIGYYSDEKHSWRSGLDYGIFPFPVIDEKIPAVALGPVDGLVIPSRSQNPEGAMLALAYLAQEENQKVMSHGSGSFAPNINVPRSFYSPMQQDVLNEIDKCRTWAFNYDLSTPPAAAEIGLNAFTEFIEFPDYYLRILSETDRQMKKVLATR